MPGHGSPSRGPPISRGILSHLAVGRACDLTAHTLTTRARPPEESGFTEKAITVVLNPEDAVEWVLNQS
jgi:hypothetical protein